MRKKSMPIGYEDLEEIIEQDLYYVDKTLMIKELLDAPGKVNLFTRPRRFGKTLNQSMIRRFFELDLDRSGKQMDHGHLFKNLRIASCGEAYLTHQQRYPVINLSLKSAKQPNYKMAYEALVSEVVKEYERHYYLLDDASVHEKNKRKYRAILNGEGTELDYATSLLFLSACLEQYHKEKVIILIDEYDVPLENAWERGFYEPMIDFIRSLFESALKTNPHLAFTVISGCLRISRESIFTGLNNLEIYSVLSPIFSDSFGFTQEEVKGMLSYYELNNKYDEVRDWYDGYAFGNKEIYNPWSIINYVKIANLDQKALPKPYWSNTSSNSIVRELVEKADMETRDEIEALIEGKSIEKPIHEDVTYGDIYESKDNLWNFLFFTGYLKKIREWQEEEILYLKLAIPNAEIRSIYRNTILSWFDKKIRSTDLSPLFTAIDTGDCEALGTIISDQLLDTISFFDYAENYYHGFLAGLLKTSPQYLIQSNRESGSGRPDILMKTRSVRGQAVILEIKVADKFQKMEAGCREALEQIEKRGYEAALRTDGYSVIKKYGVCFYQKECLVINTLSK